MAKGRRVKEDSYMSVNIPLESKAYGMMKEWCEMNGRVQKATWGALGSWFVRQPEALKQHIIHIGTRLYMNVPLTERDQEMLILNIEHLLADLKSGTETILGKSVQPQSDGK